jgi:hypothetical protein
MYYWRVSFWKSAVPSNNLKMGVKSNPGDYAAWISSGWKSEGILEFCLSTPPQKFWSGREKEGLELYPRLVPQGRRLFMRARREQQPGVVVPR